MASSDLMIFNIIMAIMGLIIFIVGVYLLNVLIKLINGRIKRDERMGRGFKIKEALVSDEAWYKINRDGAKLMILPTLLLMACGIFLVIIPLVFSSLLEAVFIFTMACVLLLGAVSVGYAISVKRNAAHGKS